MRIWRKLRNVCIKESFFGGRTNNIKFYHSVNNEEEIKYLDVCSLFPYVLKNFKYPIGHPIVLNEFEHTDISNYFGFIKCKVLPPRNLYLPVLPIVIDGKLFFPLCAICAKNRNSKCECDNRTMTNTWTSEELKLAVSRGYEIIEIYEVLHYNEDATSNKLFKKYVDLWLKN